MKNVDLIELAAAALGDLVPEVVFVGGASIGLWITDPGAPDPRATADVDVIVDVTSLSEYASLAERLRARHFHEDMESGVICRWRLEASDLLLDVMPTSEDILGFSNRWYRPAITHAKSVRLPGLDVTVWAVFPPYLLATKLDAFAARGHGDYLGSRDFQDIVALIDGRAELIGEVEAANDALQQYLATEVARLQADPSCADGIAGALRPDAASQARSDIIGERLGAIADLASPA
jgi:Nucleotidyl transferase AbiEii toxin, Type IV TA system